MTSSRQSRKVSTSLLGGILALGWLVAWPISARAETIIDGCMGTFNCTANDVKIAQIVATSITEDCKNSNTATFVPKASLETGAKARYDIGLYLALNGGSAQTDTMCSVSSLDASSGAPDNDGDACRDLNQNQMLDVLLNQPITVPCVDTNGDGSLDIDTCVSWDINTKTTCTGPSDVTPGNSAKCQCGRVEVINIPVDKCKNVVCTALDECHVAGTCDPGTGLCSNPPAPSTTTCTSDGEVCTDDHCDGSGQCVHTPNTASCDDGVFCNGTDTCLNGTCSGHSGDPCAGGAECNNVCNETAKNCAVNGGTPCTDDGNVCTIDQCDGQGACVNTPGNPGTVCRAAAGVCDVAETCTGTSATCPGDSKSTAQCRSAAGDCDLPAFCDGAGNNCPANPFKPPTTECRASAGQCDVAENCTGSSATCPSDAKSTAVCRPAADVCDVAESCDGVNNGCPADAFKPSTTECRASGGVCDVAENCTGSSAACPADAKSTAVCRPAADVCDVAESCDGVNNGCPADAFKPSTTECRASGGACDVAENCTGTGAACPSDVKSTAQCRAAAGDCDLPAVCDGTANNCPANPFKPATTECRASAGPCDVAESCTGDNANCPADGFAPSTQECRASAGICDVAENCTGTDVQCPPNAYQPTGTPCEDNDQIACTEDLCDGSGVCVSTPKDSRCDDQNACTEDKCTVARGGCVNTPLPVEPNPVVAGDSNAYGLSVRLGGSSLIAPTPDTDDTDPSNELLNVPAAPLAVVDLLQVEDSNTTGTGSGGSPTKDTSATATTAKVQLLQNPPMTGSFAVTATALKAVANCHADATTAGSDSEGSVLEGVVVNGQNLDTVREPTTITAVDPLLHNTITVSLLEQIKSGAKAGVKQPEAGGEFESDLTVNAIHVNVTDESGKEVADVVVGHAKCSASFAASCAVPPSVSGSGYVVGVTGDENVVDTSHTLVKGEVGSVMLPSTGGSDDATLKHIGPITDSPPTATLVESNTAFSHTEGTVDADNNTASSKTHSQVEQLKVLDNGSSPTNPLIAADVARAECSSTAGSNGASSTGKTVLLKPALGGGAPICVPVVPGDTCEPVANTDLPGPPLGTIIRLNEQFCDGGTPTPGVAPSCTGTDASGITVNAIHVFILSAGNPFGLPAGAEIIISNAHCDSTKLAQ